VKDQNVNVSRTQEAGMHEGHVRDEAPNGRGEPTAGPWLQPSYATERHGPTPKLRRAEDRLRTAAAAWRLSVTLELVGGTEWEAEAVALWAATVEDGAQEGGGGQ
jgi:hypothetical protein